MGADRAGHRVRRAADPGCRAAAGRSDRHRQHVRPRRQAGRQPARVRTQPPHGVVTRDQVDGVGGEGREVAGVTADPFGDAWRAQLAALGGVIRTQRQLSKLSLRDLAALTDVSNAYLSQIERGMHEPSVRVLRAIAEALSLPPDELLREAGLLDPEVEGNEDTRSTEAAIRSDPNLTDAQKEALLTVYRSYRRESGESTNG